MELPHANGAASQGTPAPSTVGDGKRRRRPTTFAGFLTSDRQLDNLITDRQAAPEELPGEEAAGAGASQDDEHGQGRNPSAATISGLEAATASQLLHAAPEPPAKRRKSSVSAKGQNGPPPQLGRPSNSGGAAPYPNVKKVVGVQNATRKALEWLQYGDLSLLDLAQSLPKLSKARVEIVMEALRAAGLVTLVRKHAPDTSGEDRVTEVYRFSAGRSAAEALEIGGGKPVALGSISKRIKSSQSELEALNVRINVLKAEAAKAEPEPQQLLDILRHFMKQDKTLEEDPFYSVAFKATCEAATKAAKVAAAARAATAEAEAERAERAAREAAQAKKQPAEATAAAAAAAAAATEAAAAEAIRNAVVAAANSRAASASDAATRTAASVVSAAEHIVPSAVTMAPTTTVAAVSPASSTPVTSVPPAATFAGGPGGLPVGPAATAPRGRQQ